MTPGGAPPRRVVVAGGGWAGLACAMALDRLGHRVTVLEAAPRPGGRARTVTSDGRTLDNGQHLLLGAYHQTLAVLAWAGVDPGRVLLRLPLDLEVMGTGGMHLRLRAPALPAPLHLAAALATARGWSPGERLGALGGAFRARAAGFRVEPDCTVAAWLRRAGQPPGVIATLWEPLCVAALNTPIAEASAAVFLRVLRDAFARRRADGDLLLPRVPLGDLFPEPAARLLQARGHRVVTGCRIRGLHLRHGRLAGVAHDAGLEPADGVVLALPPTQAGRLLAGVPGLDATARAIAALGHQPITTVYLRYPPGAGLPRPLVGLAGGLGHWVFDHGHLGRPGLLAVVISAAGAHATMARGDLEQRVAAELAALFPAWPAPTDRYAIRERRATFACTPQAEAHRPPQETGLPGLWLAGDYTRTPYPATLEGAVASGLQCAHGLHRQLLSP